MKNEENNTSWKYRYGEAINLLFQVALLSNFEENSTSPFYFEIALLLSNFEENSTSPFYFEVALLLNFEENSTSPSY